MFSNRQPTARYDAVGYVMSVVFGLLAGALYGNYLNQPHLVMTSQPWPLIVSVLLGGVVGLVGAMKTRTLWSGPLTRVLGWLAPRIPRKLHFSLSAIFIVLTVCAIVLGIVAHRMKTQRPVQELLARNLHVSFSYQLDPSGEHLPESQSPTPKWLRRLVGEDYFRTVTAVRHSGNVDIRDKDMRHFANFPDLVILDLHNNRISGAGLHQIAHLNKLEMLDLRDNWVEDAGLKELYEMTNLRNLDLSENRFTDEGLAHLAPLIHLHTLDLSDNHLSGKGLKHLKGFTELEYLDLSENNIMGPELEYLATMPKLRHLYLVLNPLTQLELKHLASLDKLDTLDLNWTQLEDAHLEPIAELHALQNLGLSGTNITDKAVQYLGKATYLKVLSIGGTKITDAGAAQLQEALPHCRISR